MPLTDFLKNFLHKLPENIQYLGTDVAPMMGPHWEQAIEEEKRRNQQMAAAQQAQANWQQQFAATQQQAGIQNQHAQSQLEAGLAEHNIIPYQQPQQSPGGQPGAPSSQGAAPQQNPQTDDIMQMLQPGWQQNFGVQQQPNGGADASAGAPPQGMPAAGGAAMPAMGGGPMAPQMGQGAQSPILPTVFNIGDKQYQNRPEPMLPLPPGMAEQWPAMAKTYPNGIPESHLPHIAAFLDANEKMQTAKNKASTGNDQKHADEIAANTVMAGVDKNWKLDPNKDPIGQLTSLDAQKAALLESQRLRGIDPNDKLEAKKLQEQTMALQQKKMQNDEREWETNHSPQVLAGMAESIRRNPDSYFDINSKNRDEVGREFTRQTGLPPPAKVNSTTKVADDTAIKVQGYVNNIQEILANRPNLISKFGAFSGRLNVAALEAGDIPGFSKAEKEDFGQLYGNIKNMNFSEVKALLQGRPAMGLVNQLIGAFATPSKVPALFEGALKATQDVIDDAHKSIQISRFGSIPKWTAAELASEYRVGMHVYHKGVKKTILGFDANGKVQLFP